MPSSYDNDNMLRADASHQDASLRAHEKENSLAPALVSQEEGETTGGRAGAPGGDARFRDAASCRGSST
jgi:hypothetical protein